MRRPTTGGDEPGATRTKRAPLTTEESPPPSRVAESTHQVWCKDLPERPLLFLLKCLRRRVLALCRRRSGVTWRGTLRRRHGTIVQCGRTEGLEMPGGGKARVRGIAAERPSSDAA